MGPAMIYTEGRTEERTDMKKVTDDVSDYANGREN